MVSSTISLVLLFLATLFLGNPVLAQRNITVDDTDPAVTYSGNWSAANSQAPSYNGSHRASTTPTDTATFHFTGVTIYYLSQLFTSPKSTLLTLDSGPTEWVNLTSASGQSENSTVQWWKEGLKNGPHQLVISLGQSSTGQTANEGEVDGFIYTVLDAKPHNNVAVIAGPVIGAVAALALGVVAFLNAHHLKYFFSSLAFMLFGWFGYSARRIVFACDKNLPPTQVTLVLADKEHAGEIDSQSHPLVLWQVVEIGNRQDDFILDIPCDANTPAFGVATIKESDEGRSIKILEKALSPATLSDELIWKDKDEDATPYRPKVLARSESGIATKIALGTYTEAKNEFKPFLVFEDFSENKSFEHEASLFLHVFRTNGCGAGQYGTTLLSAIRDGKADRLTPQRGLQFSKLFPLSTWYFRATKGGSIELKVGRNRRKDIREYNHQFKIDKDAVKDST